MRTYKVNEKPPTTFGEELKSVTRFWDERTGRGLALNQLAAAGLELDDFTAIFIRNDGWKIAATNQGIDQAEQLWPQEWETVIMKRTIITNTK